MSSYRHLKLSSGEEVICDVVAWNDYEIEIKYAYSIVAVDDAERAVRYYTFKAYMLYQETDTQHLFINPDHITCATQPNPYLVKHWQEHIKKNIPEVERAAKYDPNADKEEFNKMIDGLYRSLMDSDSKGGFFH
jgi:hypothetical protein